MLSEVELLTPLVTTGKATVHEAVSMNAHKEHTGTDLALPVGD